MSDKTASEFLNNRYMNNTCRIAAGHLGALLAKQRPEWDFRAPSSRPTAAPRCGTSPTTTTGRSINVSQNDVSSDDVPGSRR